MTDDTTDIYIGIKLLTKSHDLSLCIYTGVSKCGCAYEGGGGGGGCKWEGGEGESSDVN